MGNCLTGHGADDMSLLHEESERVSERLGPPPPYQVGRPAHYDDYYHTVAHIHCVCVCNNGKPTEQRKMYSPKLRISSTQPPLRVRFFNIRKWKDLIRLAWIRLIIVWQNMKTGFPATLKRSFCACFSRDSKLHRLVHLVLLVHCQWHCTSVNWAHFKV